MVSSIEDLLSQICISILFLGPWVHSSNEWTYVDALGRYYLFGDKALKWDDARVYCNSHGGYLVEFHTQVEIDVITVILGNFFPLNAKFWSGGTRAASETSWTWRHSLVPFNVTYWTSGQPTLGPDENCMYINIRSWQWDDRVCNILFYPLCQMT